MVSVRSLKVRDYGTRILSAPTQRAMIITLILTVIPQSSPFIKNHCVHFIRMKTSVCTYQQSPSILANVNSRSRSLYAIARSSVVCLSVVCLSSITLVHATQPVEIFRNVSSPVGTLAIL